jgi:hypothetical protein
MMKRSGSSGPDLSANRIAKWLLEEIASERRWARAFARSGSKLAAMEKEALAEHRRGETKELDPSEL